MSQSNHEYMLAGMLRNAAPAPMPTNIPPSISQTNAGRRQEFLETVKTFVCKDRNVTHGDAEDNFRVIAQLWETYLQGTPPQSLNSTDVAIMMCLFKVARLMSNPKNMENWHDLAGYAACGGGIVMKKLEEEKQQY